MQSLVSSHYPVGGRPVHRTATYRCDDTRDCIIQFCPDEKIKCQLKQENYLALCMNT